MNEDCRRLVEQKPSGQLHQPITLDEVWNDLYEDMTVDELIDAVLAAPDAEPWGIRLRSRISAGGWRQ
jgi:hypothetical protein